MNHIHIYSAPLQPATRFVDRLSGKPFQPFLMRRKPRSLVRCRHCNKLRWAKHCTVQVYYDDIPFWCKEGHGCKKGKQ